MRLILSVCLSVCRCLSVRVISQKVVWTDLCEVFRVDSEFFLSSFIAYSAGACAASRREYQPSHRQMVKVCLLC